MKTVVLLGIYAGLRINAEALTLKARNVDIGRKQLTIEAAYSENRETHTIPLHSRLVAPVQDRTQESRGELMFENREGKPILSVRTAFTNACQRANLSDVTPTLCGTPSLQGWGWQG